MQKKPIRIDKVKKRRRVFVGVKTLVQLALIIAIAVTTIIAFNHTMDNIAYTEAELAATQLQIEDARARRTQIEDSAAYTQSISFIENIARNWLGLVRRDEVIFIITEE